MEESEAISLLKRGDISGLETLVQLHYTNALRTVYLITRDLDLAEDILQTAFIRAFERIGQFSEGSRFAPWFLRSVINDALMALRHRDAGERILATGHEAWDEVSSLPSSDPEVDQLLIAQETSKAIWDTLGRLTAEQRTVIVLRYYLGMSEREMSSWLQCPPGTVKSRLSAARKQIRRLLPLWVVPAAGSE